MSNKDKIIFITGASSGIGRETALYLAKHGYKVFAGIRKKIDKNELEKLNKNITGVYIDVTNQSSIDKAFWFILKNTEKIDVLINNAGIVTAGPIEIIPIKKLKEQFDVNTFGVISVTQKFITLLNDGLIINVSSMASYGIFPYIAPYCASKRAMDILLNCLMLENKNNIKVVSVKPSAISTPIWNKSVKKARKDFEELNNSSKHKYEKELLYLEEKALSNNKKAISPVVVVRTIEKIINTKNPKPSYTVGKQAAFARFLSILPQSFVNFLIKHNLKRISK